MREGEAGYAPKDAGQVLIPLAMVLFEAAAPLAAKVYPEDQQARGQVGLCLQAIISTSSDSGNADGVLCDALSEAIASFVTQTTDPEAAFSEVIRNARTMALHLIEAGVVGKRRAMQ